MPFSAVRTAFFRFLPTLPVYFAFHLIAGQPFKLGTLCAILFLFLIVIFCLGLASFFAALQVYFRDTTSFMPYLNRIWLYLSPVLWSIETVPNKFRGMINFLEFANPLYSLLGGFAQSLVHGDVPPLHTWLAAAGWAFGAFAVGCLFFMSREREFAVRL